MGKISFFLLFLPSVLIASFSGSSYDRLVCDSGSSGGTTIVCCDNQNSVIKTDLLTFNFNCFVALDKLKVTQEHGGTVTQTDGSLLLSTSTNVAGKAIVRSKSMVHSNAGKTVEATFSAMFIAGVSDSSQWVGVGDRKDGFFVGYNGATFSVMHRINAVDTIIAQTSFNKDKLNGAGASGLTIDPTKLNIFRIKYAWLAGPIEFQFMNPDGSFVTMHKIQRANTQTAAALANVHLPFYAVVKNSGNNTDLEVRTSLWNALLCGELVPSRHCIESVIDKRITKTDILRSGGGSGSGSGSGSGGGGGGGGGDGDDHGDAGGGQFKPLFTIRNKETVCSKPNKGAIIINFFGCGAEINQTVRYKLVKNATLNSSSYSSKCLYSIAEVDKTATSYTNGELVFANTAGRYDTSFSFLKSNGYIVELNAGETLTVASRASNKTTDVDVHLAWDEYF